MDSLHRTLFFLPIIGLLVSPGCQPAARPTTKGNNAPAAGVVAAPAENVGDPEAALVAAYKAAHAAKDVEALVKLYWFGDPISGQADDEMRQTIRENAEAELRCPLVDVKIEPVAPGTHGPTVEGGIHWRPSLEVVALLTANFDTSKAPPGGYYTQQVKLTVGRRGGKCYFTVPIRE